MKIFNKLCSAVVLSVASFSVFAQGTLLIKVHYSGTNYTVESVKHIEQNLPAFKKLNPKADDLIFRLSNASDDLLGEGRIANPALIHGVLSDEEGVDHEGHKSYVDDKDGYFMLRYPYEEGMQFLELMEAQDVAVMKGVRAAPSAYAAPALKINLAPFISSEE